MLEEALSIAKQAEGENDQIFYHFTLGWAYLANDRHTKALDHWMAAIRRGLTRDIAHRLWVAVVSSADNVSSRKEYDTTVDQLLDAQLLDRKASVYKPLTRAAYHQARGQSARREQHWGQTGFIDEREWLILGPFDNRFGEGYDTPFIQESDERPDLNAVLEGAGGRARWQHRYDGNPDGFIRLNHMFDRQLDWVTAYAFTSFHLSEPGLAFLHVGSDDQVRVWLNGKEVYHYRLGRPATLDQDRRAITLRRGNNRILVKSCDKQGEWGFYLRITDRDNHPYPDIN